MIELSTLIGQRVRRVDGTVVGRLVDLLVDPSGQHPMVRLLAIGRGRRARSTVPWDEVASCTPGDISLRPSTDDSKSVPEPAGDDGHRLHLARDVLDTQVVDLAGKRLARVSDVLLAEVDDDLRAVGVEIGAAGVVRRLGLRTVARRLPRETVDWCDLHLTSPRAHALLLETQTARVHRLAPVELASLAARLPPARAAEILHGVAPASAASALRAAHPRLGARLLHALSHDDAAAVVEQLPADDAAAMLRVLPASELDHLLAHVSGDRAATLRRLLTHDPRTAGGLMTADVATVASGAGLDEVRRALVVETGPATGRAALGAVFVVDGDRRPVGVFEATDVLAGTDRPRPVPVVPADLPQQRVIDLFALHDVRVLPVVDGEGRLVGAVGVDDVLAELVAERLPGRGRFRRIRRRPHRLRPRPPHGDGPE